MTILISGKLYQIISETRVAINPDQPPKGVNMPQKCSDYKGPSKP